MLLPNIIYDALFIEVFFFEILCVNISLIVFTLTVQFLGIFFYMGICLKYAYFQNEFQPQYAYSLYAYNKESVLAVH